jgi:TolB-like protein/Tfp pilus assembly protein PilF
MVQGTRKLAAIMYTDMVGFTSIGQKNEQLSLTLLEEQRGLVRSILGDHNGREIKTMGDAFLVEFPSALNGVKCAYDIQRKTREFNTPRPEGERIHLRVGMHVGDIIESDGDISGDAVNVASRIQALADEDGVCITRQVYDQVENKFEPPMKSLGSRTLKNIKAPIEVFSVLMPWDKPTAPPPAQAEKGRIVVLPLANISADPKDEFFADGMTDELIGTLSKIKGLKVVARTSAMRYKGERKTAGEIGRELWVASLLEGSVRREGSNVRISVQLVDTLTEEQLWADKYDRELRNVFALQSEIAQQVAKALEVQLKDIEPSVLGKPQTKDPGAYTLYLRGRYYWNTRSEEGINKALKCFEEAIARDPNYASAHVGLADCYAMLGLYGFRRPSTVYPLAKEGITKALSLDDGLAEAHASMGEVMMQYYYEWDRAREELDRALKQNPSYATAHLWKSTYFATQGLLEEAIAECRVAEELDPLSMIISTELGRTFYFARRYDEAVEQYQKSLEVDSRFALAHKGLAEVYAKTSRFDKSLAEIEEAIVLSQRSVFILDDLGYIYALAGRRADAEKVLKELEDLSTETYVPPYGRAAIYAGLGDLEKSFEWLGKAFEERSFLAWIKVDPVFDGLKADERFASLLAKIRLN